MRQRLLFKLFVIVLGILWVLTHAISFSRSKSLSFEQSVVGSVLSFTQNDNGDKNLSYYLTAGRIDDSDGGHPSFHPPIPQDPNDDYPFEFAACLLTKDDKIILPEWLAYHYTVMPLRRLIVAIDPLSITSPEPILDFWNKHTQLKITTWTGNWYWKISEWQDPTTLNKMPPKGDKIIDDTKLLRQSSFYTNCLQLLKMEGYSWTVIIDTDEYFTYNSIMSAEVLGNQTIQDGILSAESRKKLLPKFIGRQNETIAHWIHQHGTKESVISRKSLCIVYPRLQFFSKVMESKEESHTSSSLLPPFGKDNIESNNSIARFHLEAFHTLQYTSHDRFDRSFKGGKPLPGKSLVNAALVKDDYKVKNPHAPFTFKCKGDVYNQVTEGWPFRVHQYSGSLKVWLSRPERTKEMWEERNKRDYPKHHDNSLTRWFPEFVRLLESERKHLHDTEDALTLAYHLTQKAHDDAYDETMDIFRRLTLNETVPPLYQWDKPLGDKRKASHLIQYLPNGSLCS